MIREIGSEFHRVELETGCGLSLPFEGSLVFSGRTAIETVLKNLPHAKQALLPSYCCDSMIEPFKKAGISVDFYSVKYENGLTINVQIPDGTDILLWCGYFGYRTPMPDMAKFKKSGGVIIEDITHSLFSEKVCNSQSDYLVASIRKWEPINCGGYCAAVNGNLEHIPTSAPPLEFVENKASAMNIKKEYLDNFDEQKKKLFLSIFVDSNQWLAKNYSELVIDYESKKFLECVDVVKQRQIRRNNAHVLHKRLENKIKFLFTEDEMDCPLFVPIIVQNRDEVRKVLTDNKIYCPIHWPHPNAKCESNLYDLELSLICDQRYTEEDMDRIVTVLSELI